MFSYIGTMEGRPDLSACITASSKDKALYGYLDYVAEKLGRTSRGGLIPKQELLWWIKVKKTKTSLPVIEEQEVVIHPGENFFKDKEVERIRLLDEKR